MTAEVQYLRPTTIEQAVSALQASAGEGLILAGGVVVNSLLNQHLALPSTIIDISRVEELRKIERCSTGEILIGALTSHEDVLRSTLLRSHAPLLCELAEEIACGRLRHQGTIGGSLCMIGQQGDPATGLLALGARIRLRGPAGERLVEVEAFYRDAFSIDLHDDEIVVDVIIPPQPTNAEWAFLKLGPRNAMDFTLIACSVVAQQQPNGSIEVIRIGLNGVAPTALRPRQTELALKGRSFGEIDWTSVNSALQSEIAPEPDLVYSEDYKRHLAYVVLRRTIRHALSRGTK